MTTEPKGGAGRRFSLLFDLDGTLVHTDSLHLAAFAEVLAGAGVTVDQVYYRSRIAGRSNDAILREAFPDASDGEVASLADRKERLYRASLGQIRPAPGAEELLQWARVRSIRCGVVTTSPRVSVETALAAAGLAGSFSLLVSGDEVRPGKPDPAPYAIALRQLAVGPGEAVAFEDSLAGIASATAAGIPTVVLLTTLDAQTALSAGAVRVVLDFRDEGLRDYLVERQARAAAYGRKV